MNRSLEIGIDMLFHKLKQMPPLFHVIFLSRPAGAYVASGLVNVKLKIEFTTIISAILLPNRL